MGREAGPQCRGSKAGHSQQTVAGGLGVVSGHSVQFSGQQGVYALGMTG